MKKVKGIENILLLAITLDDIFFFSRTKLTLRFLHTAIFSWANLCSLISIFIKSLSKHYYLNGGSTDVQLVDRGFWLDDPATTNLFLFKRRGEYETALHDRVQNELLAEKNLMKQQEQNAKIIQAETREKKLRETADLLQTRVSRDQYYQALNSLTFACIQCFFFKEQQRNRKLDFVKWMRILNVYTSSSLTMSKTKINAVFLPWFLFVLKITEQNIKITELIQAKAKYQQDIQKEIISGQIEPYVCLMCLLVCSALVCFLSLFMSASFLVCLSISVKV